MLDAVFEQLRNDNVCKSAYQFSKKFLGRRAGYYGVLKARNKQPTTDVLFTLEQALENEAKAYSSNRYPFFIRTRNHLLDLQIYVREYRERRTLLNFINFKNEKQ